MKKRGIIAGVSVVLCMMCGCLEETPLTEAEMNVVAEYAASALLYGDVNNISNNVLYDDETLQALVNPTPTPTPSPTPTPTPVPGANGSGSGSVKVTPTPLPDNTEETNQQLTTILEAPEGLTISYQGYSVEDSIAVDKYVAMTAGKDKTYVKVIMELHNDTENELVYNASQYNLEYSLDVNLGSRYKVALSVMKNDLPYMAITVPAKETVETVMIFEVKKEDINNAHLILQNPAGDAVFVKLK